MFYRYGNDSGIIGSRFCRSGKRGQSGNGYIKGTRKSMYRSLMMNLLAI